MRKTQILLQVARNSADYLPSKAFMHARVRRPGQKAHFVQVASEIELLKDVYGVDALKSLEITDDTWQILMEMGWDERYTYLLESLKFQRKTTENEGENDKLISIRNLERLDAGEMVYARHFHSLVDIYGADFRQKIDHFYGRNLLKQGDDVNSFIVDCRFLRDFSVKTQTFYTNQMQALHDDNWKSDIPFSINFTNYQADQQLSAIAKRNLLFQYGPPSKVGLSQPFRPHPFAPVITSRRNDSVEKKENLLYISPRATRFLPNTIPPNIRGVVICLSQDSHPSTSSRSACISEGVQPYQLPFARVIRSETFRPSFVHLWQLSRVFRDYFQGNTIDESIRRNINKLINKRPESRESDENAEKDEVFRSSMYHINNCSNEPIGNESPIELESKEKEKMRKIKKKIPPPSTPSSFSMSRHQRNHHRGST